MLLTSTENHIKHILEGLNWLVSPWSDREETDPANIIYTHMPISRLNGKKSFVADFALPWAKIDIEADGDWWHDKAVQGASDERRDIELRRYGWQTLRIKGSVVEKHPDIATRWLRLGIHQLLRV